MADAFDDDLAVREDVATGTVIWHRRARPTMPTDRSPSAATDAMRTPAPTDGSLMPRQVSAIDGGRWHVLVPREAGRVVEWQR